MPTTATNVYSGKRLEAAQNPDLARTMAVNFPASIAYKRGTILGELTATRGTYKAYASGNSDGSQNPIAILQYDIATDASGNVTLTDTSGQAGNEWGATRKTAPVYTSGYFRLEDLPLTGTGALDATALAAPGFRVIEGSISAAAGVIALGV